MTGPLGYCPLGCGLTLRIALTYDQIRCVAEGCPRPTAAAEILADPETEHIVHLGPTTFNILHPLRERLDDRLLDCGVGDFLASMDTAPMPPGRYRLTFTPDGRPNWTRPRQETPDA